MNSPQEINFFKGKNVKKISLGARHSLVLTHEGNIYSFGDNSEGQCSGVEKAITVPRLVEFPNKDRIIDICCGYNHSVALSINGDIFTWGDSSTGKLGYPVYDSVQYYPKIIPFLKYRYINLIAAGPWQTCVAISNENEKDLLLN